MEVVNGMQVGQSRGSHVTGDAGEIPECELMH